MSVMSFWIFILILCCSMVYPSPIDTGISDELNNRPVIGVLAQHFHPTNPFPIPGDSYISAAYVKYLESAGARVVPIKINQDSKVILKLLSSINGVLFPGGGSWIQKSPYQKNAKLVYEYALKEKDKNKNNFPIWGTCLGFQQLHQLVADTDAVMSDSSGTWDVSKRLPDLDTTGKMTKNIPDDLLQVAKVEKLAYHAHRNCVRVDHYDKYPELNKFFKILSKNIDSKGIEFVSIVEAHNYPIYGTQWHPEISMFEFNAAGDLGHNVNHSSDAIRLAQHFANFFVNETRKNPNRFSTPEEEQNELFYNYQPIYSAKHKLFSEQEYVFNSEKTNLHEYEANTIP